MPGTIGGAFVVDYLGPKNTMVRSPSATYIVDFKVTPFL
jgi:hypothetical protein